MLNNDVSAPDLNGLRLQERLDKSRQVKDFNSQLSDYRSGMSKVYSVHQEKPGDIFDSMFERPKHWREFYGNIVASHQMSQIGRHEINYLQRELVRGSG